MGNITDIDWFIENHWAHMDSKRYQEQSFLDDMLVAVYLFPIDRHYYSMTQANVVNEYINLLRKHGFTHYENVTYTPNKELKVRWATRRMDDITRRWVLDMTNIMLSLDMESREEIKNAYGKCNFIMELG